MFQGTALLPWNNGIGDNKSGFGVEDDSNTGEAGKRELVLVFTLQ